MNDVRLGLFSADALRHIRNIMEFISNRFNSEINKPTKATACCVKYGNATNGEIVAKRAPGYYQWTDYLAKSKTSEEFYAKYANCFKRAALVSLAILKDYEGKNWLRTNNTHVIQNGTTIRDAYFLYEFFKRRPNLDKKYGAAYVNEIIGHENDPFLTEQEETRLRLIAELKEERKTKVDQLYAEHHAVVEQINQEYAQKTSVVENEYDKKIAEIEQQFDMMKKMASGEVDESAA